MADQPQPIRLSRPDASWRLFLRALRPKGGVGDLRCVPAIWLPDQKIDSEHLSAYRDFCGWAGSDRVPLPYFFVLGFLPQAHWVTLPEFPVKAVGMVHVSNTFEVFDDVRAGDRLEIRVQGLELEVVEKGRLVRVETQFLRQGQAVARSLSTSFARGGGHGRAPADRPRSSAPSGPATETWELDPVIGRRYASVSGDYNPIHLNPWAARAFGFPRAIAHGMYLVGRAVASIESRSAGSEPLRFLEVRFKTPTFLPSRPKLYVTPGETTSFELWNESGNRPHLEGRVGTAPPLS